MSDEQLVKQAIVSLCWILCAVNLTTKTSIDHFSPVLARAPSRIGQWLKHRHWSQTSYLGLAPGIIYNCGTMGKLQKFRVLHALDFMLLIWKMLIMAPSLVILNN